MNARKSFCFVSSSELICQIHGNHLYFSIKFCRIRYKNALKNLLLWMRMKTNGELMELICKYDSNKSLYVYSRLECVLKFSIQFGKNKKISLTREKLYFILRWYSLKELLTYISLMLDWQLRYSYRFNFSKRILLIE